MHKCKNFLSAISEINFPEGVVGPLRVSMIQEVVKDLEQQQNKLEAEIDLFQRAIPSSGPDGASSSQHPLQLIINKKQTEIQEIDHKIEDLREEPGVLGEENELTPHILQQFAANFRNVKHLSLVLSDAPESIKKHQTELYNFMLSKLPEASQEAQLALLSTTELTTIVEQATKAYDEANKENQEFKNQAQLLAQRALFQIIQHECKGNRGDLNFIENLKLKIPDVRASAILDNFSDYQNAEGQTAGDLLWDALPPIDWTAEDAPQIAWAIKSLFHRFRSGREDLIEYIQKRQKNMERDLFWARDIHDISLLTESGEAAALFRQFSELDYFKKNHEFDPPDFSSLQNEWPINTNSPETKRLRKLQGVDISNLTDKIGLTRMVNGVPNKVYKHLPIDWLDKKNTAQRLSSIFQKLKDKFTSRLDPSKEEIKTALTAILTEANQKPEISTENGNIKAVFFNYSVEDAALERFADDIRLAGGLRSQPNMAIAERFRNTKKRIPTIFDHAHSLEITASSLDDIKEHIRAEQCVIGNTKPLQAYLTSLEELDQKIHRDISELGLNPQEELKLRKLLELCIADDHIEELLPNIPSSEGQSEEAKKKAKEAQQQRESYQEALKSAFERLKVAQYKDALGTPHLESAIEKAYQHLGSLDPESAPNKTLQKIIERAGSLTSSTEKRKAKKGKLEEIFSEPLEQQRRTSAIADLFLEEYNEMKKTLWPEMEKVQASKLSATGPAGEGTSGVGAVVEAGPSDAYEYDGPSSNSPHQASPTQPPPNLEHEIEQMASDLSKLIERTQKGEPTLREEETQAYFEAIQLIAKHLKNQRPSISLDQVQFKIPHSSERVSITVTRLDNQEKIILPTITLTQPLPYSLIKPPGDTELMFSYGGTRGVIAPFAGFEDAYKKAKGRYFTHSRLLGVGQYGAVKEVEGLLTGLNQVLKTGLPLQDRSEAEFEAYRAELKVLRESLLTRPIPPREDPLYRIESDILQALSDAEQANRPGGLKPKTQYWHAEKTKKRGSDDLIQYEILTERGKGDTYADTANEILTDYRKDDPKYHNPVLRTQDEPGKSITELTERLALALAIVEEAQRLYKLGFTHNDIKPENFLYKRQADGRYKVKYIDWATGACELEFEVESDQTLKEIFEEKFGNDPKSQLIEQGNTIFDGEGRFVKKNGPNKYSYGVNAKLQILQGAHNGTLPYISPNVLEVKYTSHETLPTKIPAGDPIMDNWALTAMAFGICNRAAYFTLVIGRIVADYFVPGIIEIDPQHPDRLKIVNTEKFNAYFSCRPEDNVDESDPEGTRKQDAVMYIPGNTREGEPLHLYRRLEAIRSEMLDLPQSASTGSLPPFAMPKSLPEKIDAILKKVHGAISSGDGLSKEDLQKTLTEAQTCIREFQATDEQRAAASDNELLDDTIKKLKQFLTSAPPSEGGSSSSASPSDPLRRELRKILIKEKGISALDILCTLPKTDDQKNAAAEILKTAYEEPKFLGNLLFGSKKPGKFLLQAAIEKRQTEILNVLLNKIHSPEAFYKQVKAQGLLHQALEQGLTEVAEAIIDACPSDKVFKLMMQTYGPAEKGRPIQWNTNAFHIAIRNNDKAQLQLILRQLPSGNQYAKEVKEALHLSALFSNYDFYQMILNKYNQQQPPFAPNPLQAKDILQIKNPPVHPSPYHLFLKSEACSKEILWQRDFQDESTAKPFLLEFDAEGPQHPTLIAAANQNYTGLDALFEVAADHLNEGEWITLLFQTDEQGKNLLNHMLEQDRFDQVDKVLNTINRYCGVNHADVVHQLLSNPHPINPLKNHLKNEHIPSEKKYEVAKKLLDAMCENHTRSTPPMQGARTATLLANIDWLVTQADSTENHDLLKDLLDNDALEIEYKKVLFDNLVKACPQESKAKDFYDELLTEINKKQPPFRKQETLPNMEAIFTEAARQQNTPEDYIRLLELTKETDEARHLEELNKAQEELRASHGAEREALERKFSTKMEEALQARDTALGKAIEETQAEAKLEFENRYVSEKEKLETQYQEKLRAQLEKAISQKNEKQEQALESQQVDFESQIQSLEQKHQEAFKTLEQELERAHETELREQAQDFEARIEQVQEKYKEKETDFDKRSQTSDQEHRVALEALEKRYEQMSKKKDTQHQEELESQRVSAELNQERHHDQILGLEKTNSELQSNLTQLQETLRSKKTDLEAEQKALVTSYENENTGFKKALERVQKEKEQIQLDKNEEISKKEELIEALKAEHQAEKSELEEQLRESKQEFESSVEASSEVKNKIAELEQEIEFHKAENEELRKNFFNLQQTHEKETKKLREALASQKELNTEGEQYSEEVKDQNVLLDEKDEFINQLYQQLKELRETNQVLDAKKLENKTLNNNLEEKLNTVNAKLETAVQELDEVQSELNSKQKALEEQAREYDVALEKQAEQIEELKEHNEHLQIELQQGVPLDSDFSDGGQSSLSPNFENEKKPQASANEGALQHGRLVEERFEEIIREFKEYIGEADTLLASVDSATAEHLEAQRKGLISLVRGLGGRYEILIKSIESEEDAHQLQQDMEEIWKSAVEEWERILENISVAIKEKLDEERQQALSPDGDEEIDSPEQVDPNVSHSAAPSPGNAPTHAASGTQTDPESPPQKLSTHKIYANLASEPVSDQEIESLFPTSAQGDAPLISINVPEATTLTEADAQKFVSGGIKLRSPSHQDYTFKYDETRKNPTAVLTRAGLNAKAGETSDQQQQRLAITVMNMIENVLTHSNVLKINTRNPFIARIAEAYIKHLKTKFSDKLDVTYKISGCDVTKDPERVQNAKDVFNKLIKTDKFEPSTVKSSAAWFKSAKAHHQALRKKGPETGGRPPLKPR